MRIATGSLEWSARPIPDARTTIFQPVVEGDAVVAGYSTFGTPLVGGVVMVDARSGRERWHRGFPRSSPGQETGFAGGPVVTGAVVIAASGDGWIHAFDRRTGAARWALPPVVRGDGRVQDRDWRALVVRGSLLIAGSVTGVVTAFDLAGPRERWRFVHPDGGSTGLHISADDEIVYVPHLGGRLVAVCLRDGHRRWEIGGFSDGFIWAPTMAGGIVYVAASRSGLFAWRR
jgi:outer membrane protein assembly factor BamB